MDSVTAAEDAALGVLSRPCLVDLPGCDVLNFDFDVGVADHLADARHHRLGAQVWLGAIDVEAPARDPLAPRADGAEGALADLAIAGGRSHDPVHDARPEAAVM